MKDRTKRNLKGGRGPQLDCGPFSPPISDVLLYFFRILNYRMKEHSHSYFLFTIFKVAHYPQFCQVKKYFVILTLKILDST
jgi:hypothetical protein